MQARSWWKETIWLMIRPLQIVLCFPLYLTRTFNFIHSRRNGKIKWGQVVMQWNCEWDQAHLLFKNGEKMKLIFIYLLQPPIRKIYKFKNIIHQRWLRKEMKRIFSNYVTMLKLLTKNFKSNNLIRTQKPYKKTRKVGTGGWIENFLPQDLE